MGGAHRTFFILLALTALFGCRRGDDPVCAAPGPKSEGLVLVTLDGPALDRAKSAEFACPYLWGADVKQLRSTANRRRTLPLRSVMEKSGTAPSGDKHDYISIGRYFWPDPKAADGLPWVRRDGEVNPAVFSPSYDKAASDAMFATVSQLSAGYFFLGDETYAARAVEQIDAWFLAPATAMTPHLIFAEGVPGVAEGRAQGVIEFSKVIDLIDAVGLLTGSEAWKNADQAAFRTWMERYHGWLTSHPNALREAAAKNNHGTYYDAQVAALALYLGRIDEAKGIIEAVKTKRIATQILPSGEQPEEVARANSWFYSVFNLQALMDLAAIGDRVGVDLWSYRTDDGRSIKGALEYLLRFGIEGQVWPYGGGIELGRIYEPLLRASAAYQEPRYAELARSLGDTDNDGDVMDDEKARRVVRLLWGHAGP